MLEAHWTACALRRASDKAGISNASNSAMMPMTVSSSTRENPAAARRRRRRGVLIMVPRGSLPRRALDQRQECERDIGQRDQQELGLARVTIGGGGGFGG